MDRSALSRRAAPGALLCLVLGAGCAASRPAPSPPRVHVGTAVVQFGGLLDGALPDADDALVVVSDPGDSVRIRVRAVWTDEAHVRPWPLASQHARWIAWDRETPGSALGAAATLTRACRVAVGDVARDFSRELPAAPQDGDTSVSLARGRTAVVEVATETSSTSSASFALALERPHSGDGVRVAIRASSVVAVEHGVRWEQLALRDELRAGDPLLVTLPVAPAREVVAAIELEEAPDAARDPAAYAAHVRRAAFADESVRIHLGAARDGRRALSPVELEVLELSRMLVVAAESDSSRRRAMVALCDARRAPFAADFALVADDERLAAWTRSVIAAARESRADEPVRAEPWYWRFEREAWSIVAEAVLAARAGEAERALLLRHGGELGRSPSVLLDLLRESEGRSEFEAALEREHRALLADRSPAARARADGWMRARGLAVAGFDPLGTEEERRAALHAAAPDERP